MNQALINLKRRHSVRSYSEAEIPENIMNTLRAEVTFINSHEAGLNFQICFNDDEPFRGFSRSYGMFRNVRNYLAVVIDSTFPNALERAGFYAEQFVMKCVELGLGTSFVGGTFSRSHTNVRMEVYEKMPFIVAFGIPEIEKTSLVGKFAAKISHRNSKSGRDLFDGTDQQYSDALKRFPWLEDALEAVACAPSALNEQPVRITLKSVDTLQQQERKELKEAGYEWPEAFVAYTINRSKYAAELGIAKFNFAAVVPGNWYWGETAPFLPD